MINLQITIFDFCFSYVLTSTPAMIFYFLILKYWSELKTLEKSFWIFVIISWSASVTYCLAFELTN